MICRHCSVLIPAGSNFCPRCGRPMEASAPVFVTAENAGSAPAAPRKRGIRKLILLLVLVPVVLMTTCVGAIFGGLFYAMRNNEPYQHALRLARENPQLREALGEPIEAGWLVSGSISTDTTGGSAKLSIPISGPKGSARIYVDATQRAGKWEYEQLQVGVAGQDLNVDLKEPPIKLQ
jgi:hypothetical protein